MPTKIGHFVNFVDQTQGITDFTSKLCVKSTFFLKSLLINSLFKAIPKMNDAILHEVTQIIQESPRVKRFFLKRKDGLPISFQSGQFVMIFNENFSANNQSRSYSIASISNQTQTIELCIVLNEQGLFTPWLFSLEVGSDLFVSIPQGSFVFRGIETPVKHVFVCTGTGIAPFRSMIQESLMQGCETVLVFGNRWKEDILYAEHWKTLQENNPLFRFIPVLSREEVEGCKSGYVHPHYERELKGLEDARIYVCGWKDMCMETRDRLKSLGFNRRQYFFEQYD